MARVWFAILMERSIEQTACAALFDVCMNAGANGYRRISLPYMRTDTARNRIIAAFLKEATEPDDVLVMLDADHAHPSDTVQRLADNPHDIGVIGALAFRRGEPHDPCVFFRAGEKLVQPHEWEQGRIKATIVGTGAIAVKRWVFDALNDRGDVQGGLFFRYAYNIESEQQPSEDIYFGLACELAGIPHYCDTTLVIPHLTTAGIDEWSYRAWMEDHPEREAKAVRVA